MRLFTSIADTAHCFYVSSFGDVLFGSERLHEQRAQMIAWIEGLSKPDTADCNPDDG